MSAAPIGVVMAEMAQVPVRQSLGVGDGRELMPLLRELVADPVAVGLYAKYDSELVT